MLYLASPYTHDVRRVRVERFRAVCEYAGQLTNRGLHIFCPIAHSHPIAEECSIELPTTFDYWEAYDKKFIGLSEGLVVMTIKGWDVSKGVLSEIAMAKDMHKPIHYSKHDELSNNWRNQYNGCKDSYAETYLDGDVKSINNMVEMYKNVDIPTEFDEIVKGEIPF